MFPDLESEIEKPGDELEVDLHGFKMAAYSPVQLKSSIHNLISKRNIIKTAVMGKVLYRSSLENRK